MLEAYCLTCERVEPVRIGDSARNPSNHVTHFHDTRMPDGVTWSGYRQFGVICEQVFVTVDPKGYARGVTQDWAKVTCKACLRRRPLC